MNISFDELDFASCCAMSTEWGADMATHDRWAFLRVSPKDSPRKNLSDWSYAYWVSDWTSVILMRSWLDQFQYGYRILRDTAVEGVWVILTDYYSGWGSK